MNRHHPTTPYYFDEWVTLYLVDARWFTDDDSRTLRHSVGFTVDKAHAGQVRVTVTPWEQAA